MWQRGRAPKAPNTTTLVAYIALFLSIAGGTAFAARHYLITSKGQISPKVRNALRGRRGPAGPTGPPGVDWSVRRNWRDRRSWGCTPERRNRNRRLLCRGDRHVVSRNRLHINFLSDAAAKAPTPTLVTSANDSNCQGSATKPTASAGYLCVYVGNTTNVAVSGIYDPDGGNAGTASAYGAGVVIDSAAAGNFYADGTWAVTAP